MKKAEFLRIAGRLNDQLEVTPLLFGSLGLEQRLHADLSADDIDILVPEAFLAERWRDLSAVMEEDGYVLCDADEHEFERDGLSAAFAALESLAPFAGVDLAKIPAVEEAGVRYLLLGLEDYLKVYTASSKDGYRKNTKHKNDSEKIERIKRALAEEQRR